MTTLHGFGGVLRTAFGHFLLGSHNFVVMALGSCVKWPSLIGDIFGHNRLKNPSVYKSNHLHVDILQFSFIKSGHIL